VFDAQHVFGPASRLQAQSIGEPGQRTFRLLVESPDGGAAVLWLEKEQLQALGLAVEQLLAEPQGRLASSARAVSQPDQDSFPDAGALDFKVGRLALGQDESELENGPRYVLLAYDLETTSPEEQDEPSSPPTFAVRATRDQLRALSRNIAEVVAAGRPRCPLCGEPVQHVGDLHGCVRSNGHRV